MLISAVGSRFFIGSLKGWKYPVQGLGRISDYSVTAEDFTGTDWQEVKGVRGLGRIGGEWELQEGWTPNYVPIPKDYYAYDVHLGGHDSFEYPLRAKSVAPLLAMEIVVALDEEDGGQLAILAAERTTFNYPFRLMLSNGVSRFFIALVTKSDLSMDEADAVVCWTFGLVLQSTLVRG